MTPTQIDSGLGIVTMVEGAPGPASGIAYTCTLVMPDGVFEGVEHLVPFGGRWPGPIIVQPLATGTIFPVYRSSRTLQACMPFEAPQFAPCGQSLGQPGGGGWGSWFAQLASAPEAVKRAIAEELRKYL